MSYPLSGRRGDTLVSPRNMFEFGFFTPQVNDDDAKEVNRSYVGVWCHDSLVPRTVVWVANRDRPLPVVDSCGVVGLDSLDGNLKVWCDNGNVFPLTSLNDDRYTSFNRTLQLLDSGNLIISDGRRPSGPGRRIVWQSFENPTDTFLPGMRMDDIMELVSWTGPTDPAPGNYTFRLDQDAYTVRKRSSLHWQSRGTGYNELPDAVAQLLSKNYTGLDGASNGDKSFPRDYYNHSRLLMSSSGEIQYYYYNTTSTSSGGGGRWSLLWLEPRNRCSVYRACGKSSVCNAGNEPVCQCLPGFSPVSWGDWNDGRYSDGCQRETVKCTNRKRESFLSILLMKADAGQVSQFDPAQNDPAKCRDECLDNCDCEAYSYSLVNKNNNTTGLAANVCWIWTAGLVNLNQEYAHFRLNLSLRVPLPAIANTTSRICQPCVINSVPYPLSTGPACGDPLYYSFHCDNSTGEIRFLALSGSYQVVGIFRDRHSFVILIDPENGDDACSNRNSSSSQILKLNQSLPFTVTNWCYTYSNYIYSRVRNQIEIRWEPAVEPTCDFSTDCKDWPNSDCHDKLGEGQKRCYCNKSYRWDHTIANCAQETAILEGKYKKKTRTRYVVVFSVLVAGGVLAFCFSYILYQRRRIAKGTGNRGNAISSGQANNLLHENDKSTDVPFYNLDIILSATDSFSDANKLGQGGFGPVYKGTFPGGREIAVKRLSSLSGQGVDEFLNEVTIIAKLQHRNLVRLLGYCIDENEKILLYEYMPNRSLDAFVFDQNKSLLLDWTKRFDVILGIARGLLYLHQDSRLRIIHRDLKTSNILLDEEMNPKISDFGLARIVEGKGTEASTNKVVGTYGYMSPEYALEGQFSIKSDVFSFGVMMLEIISGKKNAGFSHPGRALNLLGHAWRLWSESRTLDLVDPTMLRSCNESQVMTCVNVGLLCIQEDPNDRPSMTNVVIMLGSETSRINQLL